MLSPCPFRINKGRSVQKPAETPFHTSTNIFSKSNYAIKFIVPLVIIPSCSFLSILSAYSKLIWFHIFLKSAEKGIASQVLHC